MKKFFLIIVFVLNAFLIVSCKGPGLVVSTQLSTPAHERPGSPGPGYVWTDGDWIVENRNYVWHEGHWDKPRRNKIWQPGHWEQTTDGWYWKRGRWH